MKNKSFRLLLSFFVFIGILLAVYVGGVILGNASSDVAAFDKPPEYLLILGCRLEGEEPGVCLEERLDAAVTYLKEHEKCMAVASGGQGKDEVTSEAKVISGKLQEKGIPSRRILLEEQSTSTYENFLFSKQMLDEREGDAPYYIAFTTNDFHVYRARSMAEYVGFESPVAVSAESSTVTFYPNFLREIAAVLVYWIKY
ncbi:MAG: YdcF family protein [Clostridia bacterium]|nr:YdcF family protein [Clostridia bacterium]